MRRYKIMKEIASDFKREKYFLTREERRRERKKEIYSELK